MVIHFSKYPGSYRIVSLAKSEAAAVLLAEKELPYLRLTDQGAVIFPEEICFPLSDVEREVAEKCCDLDVFEIDERGYAYRYYSCDSNDNAILVTNQCNSNCIMCPTPDAVRRKEDHVDIERLLEIVSHFPADAPHITITGGEPFLKKEGVFALLKYLKEQFPLTEFLFLTNGRAFCLQDYTKQLIETKPERTVFGIPLHGADAVLHDHIVRAPGAFEQTAKGIENMVRVGAMVEIRIVISRLNADAMDEIADLIIRRFPRILRVKFMGLEMTGNAAINKSEVWISYPQAFLKIRNAVRKLIYAGIDVGIYNFPLCAVEKSFWNICEKSITDYKVWFSEKCESCAVKDACGGIFAGTKRLAVADISPIPNEL